MDIKVKKGWDDITLKQYEDIVSIQQCDDSYDDLINKGAEILKVVYGVDGMSIAYNDFLTLTKTLDFFKHPIVPKKVRNTYTLNGNQYQLNTNFNDFTTAQYVDFQNYKKRNDYVGMLSVVMIPKGHQYCDGYDNEQVMDDLCNLPITDAMGVLSFFLTCSFNSTKFLIRCSLRKLTRNKKMAKETKKELKERMKEMEAMITELYHISSHIAK